MQMERGIRHGCVTVRDRDPYVRRRDAPVQADEEPSPQREPPRGAHGLDVERVQNPGKLFLERVHEVRTSSVGHQPVARERQRMCISIDADKNGKIGGVRVGGEAVLAGEGTLYV